MKTNGIIPLSLYSGSRYILLLIDHLSALTRANFRLKGDHFIQNNPPEHYTSALSIGSLESQFTCNPEEP